MLFDSHMHCDYSTDSSMNISEAIRAARKANVGMIVTEHWDYDYPTNPYAFLFDVDDYFKQFNVYRSESILLGIEVGMQKHIVTKDAALIKAHPFDCVIASMHCVNGRDLYEPNSYKGLTKAEALQEFLEDSIANVRLYSDFDIFGHIDYISRYMPYEDQELYYEEFPALWDELFKLLIDGGKVLEINTRRLDSLKAVETLEVLYQRYQELGGRYISLGSDAHYKEHVGRRMAVAKKMADNANLVPVYFQDRKMKIMEE